MLVQNKERIRHFLDACASVNSPSERLADLPVNDMDIIVLSISILTFFLKVCMVDATAPYHQGWQHKKCLTETEACSLVETWYSIFSSRDFGYVESTVTELVTDDFTAEDETINFGVGPCVLPPEGPYATGKEAFLFSLQLRLAEVSAEFKDETYETIRMVHDCNTVAFRWQLSATALGINPNL